MSEVICPGPCNSRYRRLTAEYEAARAKHEDALARYGQDDPSQQPPEAPKSPDVAPWIGDPWCGKCKAIIHGELGELDDLHALLATRPPLDVAGTDEEVRVGRVSGTPEDKSPSERMDELVDLNGWLRTWESAFRGGDPPARRGYLATETTTIVAWLAAHFEPHITHPDLALDYGSEIRQWHRSLADRARAGTIDKHMKQPCPRCRLFTLWARDGEDYVRCINDDCNRRMTREEFRQLADAALFDFRGGHAHA
jgi:hypothetical protein